MKMLDELHKVGAQRVGLTGDTPKGSGLLFIVLLIVSVLIANFFGMMVGFDLSLMINFIIWYALFLVAWLFFILMLFRYKFGLCSLKSILKYFSIFIIVSIGAYFLVEMQSREGTWGVEKDSDKRSSQNSIANNLIGVDSQTSAPAETASTNSGTQTSVVDQSQWIDYTGVKSSFFTFRYPSTYEIQESGTSTLLYVDKKKDYDYHVTFTVLDGVIPVSADCEGLAKGVAAGFKNGEVRQVQSWADEGYSGCEYGINIEQNGSKIYETAYNLTSKDKTFYITAYAKSLSDLSVLKIITKSFKLK